VMLSITNTGCALGRRHAIGGRKSRRMVADAVAFEPVSIGAIPR
jgi:hypothetical protein